MSNTKYQPPEQGKFGQIFDTVFLLVLVVLALYIPLNMGWTGGGTTYTEVTDPTWEKLNQNETMAQQWEKLGFTPETAEPIISTRYDYTIDWLWLIITAVLVIGYFVFMLKISEKQYREVIAEKFDNTDRQEN